LFTITMHDCVTGTSLLNNVISNYHISLTVIVNGRNVPPKEKILILSAMYTILQTPRMIIREFRPDEEETYLEMYRDADINRHLTKRTDEERRDRFREMLSGYGSKKLGRWGIFDPADGDLVGTCKLLPNDTDPEKMEIGYVLAKKYWSKGLATELAKALVDYGFNQIGLKEICACVDFENIASQNVLLKTGFERSGNISWHGRELPFFVITK